MNKNESDLLKWRFELHSGITISRTTWYKYLGFLKSRGYDQSIENIYLIASLRKLTVNLELALDSYEAFKKSTLINFSHSVTRRDVYNVLLSQVGNLSDETFRRWMRKAGITAKDNHQVPHDKLHKVYLCAYIYLAKKQNKKNAAN